MSRIISIGTAVPKNGLSQSRILDYLHTAYNDDTTSRKLKVLFQKSGISTRYSAVSDFDGNLSESKLFISNEVLPDIETRINLYKEHASSLAISAINNSLGKLNSTISEFLPTHLITVTCTGLYAPGIDSELIEQLNLPNDIFHTSINFMGCNAAFPALKIADMIAKTQENARVIVVCVELCTLHFQPKNNTDNLLSNSIFGDGAAAVLVVSDNFANQAHYNGMEMNGFYSILLSKGKNYMGWNINPVNFEMILDNLIPDFIGDEVIDILSKAGKYLSLTRNTIDYWAIHPGGKKILETIKKRLQLNDSDLKYSYKVLEEYGNMSSPTILFVLNEIIQDKHNTNETIFSMGFGPGLSIETAKFTYVE